MRRTPSPLVVGAGAELTIVHIAAYLAPVPAAMALIGWKNFPEPRIGRNHKNITQNANIEP
jgi:hypothetical protein